MAFFARAFLLGGYTVAWPNDADFAPEALYDSAREAAVQCARMPEICRFFGIVIRMFWVDHARPHFHAQYAEHVASIDIRSRSVESHGFPLRALRLVEEWRDLHERELLDNWERMRRGEAPERIAPLD